MKRPAWLPPQDVLGKAKLYRQKVSVVIRGQRGRKGEQVEEEDAKGSDKVLL